MDRVYHLVAAGVVGTVAVLGAVVGSAFIEWGPRYRAAPTLKLAERPRHAVQAAPMEAVDAIRAETPRAAPPLGDASLAERGLLGAFAPTPAEALVLANQDLFRFAPTPQKKAPATNPTPAPAPAAGALLALGGAAALRRRRPSA